MQPSLLAETFIGQPKFLITLRHACCQHDHPSPAGSADPQPPLGTRVLLGGRHAATVRYVGPVDGQSGTWVGIEYDEPGRGKHDGCHAGRRYFSCTGGPATGSLVRLPKFLEAADCGRSLVEAACERYDCSGAGGSSACSSAGDVSGGASAAGGEGEGGVHRMYLSTAGNRRVAVELVEKAGGAAARRASASGAGVAVLVGQRISSVVRVLPFCCLRLQLGFSLQLAARRPASPASSCCCPAAAASAVATAAAAVLLLLPPRALCTPDHLPLVQPCATAGVCGGGAAGTARPV